MNTTVIREVVSLDSIVVSYPPLESALVNWVDATTDPTNDQRDDLLHDKKNVVSDFFKWICKPVHEITPNDVKAWQNELEQRNLALAMVSAMINRISGFSVWLIRYPDMPGLQATW